MLSAGPSTGFTKANSGEQWYSDMFLENNMRDHWDFSGVPVQIYFRQK